MQAASSRLSDILVIRPAGRIDHLNAAELGQLLAPHIDACRSGGDKLVIDLGQIDYISSAGLRVFLLAAKRINEAQGRMILCSLKDSVKQVFDIAGFSSFLNLAGSIEEAIKSCPPLRPTY